MLGVSRGLCAVDCGAQRVGGHTPRDRPDPSGRAGTVQQVWGHDDFLPVAAAFDRLFMSWGWTLTLWATHKVAAQFRRFG